MTRQEIASFLHLVEAYNFLKFYVTTKFRHRNIHNIEAWGQGEILFWSGNELRHSLSDKTQSPRFPWLSVRQMGTPDAYQATALQQRKQKPRCRMYRNSADGPSRVFTVYKKRDGALIRVSTLPGDLFPPAGLKQNIPPKAPAAAVNDLCPFTGRGWVATFTLSRCANYLKAENQSLHTRTVFL